MQPAKPDTAVLCVRCHAASAAKPKNFPQVDPADHSNGLPCETCHKPHSPAIEAARCKMKITAAVSCWFCFPPRPLPGNTYWPAPRSLAELHHDRALVGNADRHPEVHRLRQLRARLPDGKRCARWILPHLGRALPRVGLEHENPEVISPDGGKEGFPLPKKTAENTSSFPRCATIARIRPARRYARWARRSSARTAWCWSTRNTALAALLRSGLPLRLPLHPSGKEGRGQVHAVLPPDHQGTHHRVLRSVPDRGAAAGRLEEPQRSDSRIPEDPSACRY